MSSLQLVKDSEITCLFFAFAWSASGELAVGGVDLWLVPCIDCRPVGGGGNSTHPRVVHQLHNGRGDSPVMEAVNSTFSPSPHHSFAFPGGDLSRFGAGKKLLSCTRAPYLARK